MFSVSPAEILTIAVVMLIVFGPRRIPEMSRKAGRVLKELRTAASEFRTAVEREAGGSLALEDVRREMAGTLGDLGGTGNDTRSGIAGPAADEPESDG